MTSAVTIAEVHKHYGALYALRGIDFEIKQGEFFGLLGPNGAGKSTLINIMAGLTYADRGAVRINGFDVRRDYRQARRALGVVPQELVYDPFFDVREMLRLQSGYFGFGRENHAWIDELLETLNLGDKADVNMYTLSGGMKRRVLIAQAMVHKPPVLVLDEPTAGVDVELRQILWRFARRLHQDGHTIVLTTHYLEEAEQLCERIAILDQGSICALDTKQALLSRSPYRRVRLTLADAAIELPESILRLVEEREAQSITLRLHRLDDQLGAVLEAMHQCGGRLLDVHTVEPGLEEVFMELTCRKRGEVGC
ncbi:MAG: ABC transporter [Gammaproteobacteria bacterium RBG_16_57_12]|nr:MAG: ABC transporter [Gammaproteobacteria bacterium RBG_16_57_12]